MVNVANHIYIWHTDLSWDRECKIVGQSFRLIDASNSQVCNPVPPIWSIVLVQENIGSWHSRLTTSRMACKGLIRALTALFLIHGNMSRKCVSSESMIPQPEGFSACVPCKLSMSTLWNPIFFLQNHVKTYHMHTCCRLKKKTDTITISHFNPLSISSTEC